MASLGKYNTVVVTLLCNTEMASLDVAVQGSSVAKWSLAHCVCLVIGPLIISTVSTEERTSTLTAWQSNVFMGTPGAGLKAPLWQAITICYIQ